MVSAWGIVGIASAMLCSEGKKGEGVNESAQNPSLRNKLPPFIRDALRRCRHSASSTIEETGRLCRVRFL
jgi:hypothetical protein